MIENSPERAACKGELPTYLYICNLICLWKKYISDVLLDKYVQL